MEVLLYLLTSMNTFVNKYYSKTKYMCNRRGTGFDTGQHNSSPTFYVTWSMLRVIL